MTYWWGDIALEGGDVPGARLGEAGAALRSQECSRQSTRTHVHEFAACHERAVYWLFTTERARTRSGLTNSNFETYEDPFAWSSLVGEPPAMHDQPSRPQSGRHAQEGSTASERRLDLL